MKKDDYIQINDKMVLKDEEIRLEIALDVFCDEAVEKMEKVAQIYFEKLETIAEFCVNDFNFKFFLRHLTKEMIQEKLQTGQRLFYDGKWFFLFFDPKEKGYGLLAIRFDENVENFYLEDECCEGTSCNY